MKSVQFWKEKFKPALFLCALLFPLFWIVIGGILRTPLLIAGGVFGLYGLWKRRLHLRVRAFFEWGVIGVAFAGMCVLHGGSESELMTPGWYILLIFYSVPAGVMLAHCREDSTAILNWIFACMMVLFAIWAYLVMQQVDMAQLVRVSAGQVSRGDTRYPVELFGIFSWDNVKMQIIPFCAYPLAAIIAISCRGPVFLRGLILVGAVLGGYVGGAFLTRTVFMAAGFAVAVGIIVYMFKADYRRRFVMAMSVLALAAGTVAVVQIVPVVNEYVMSLVERFSLTADDSRQYLWESSIQLILSHPLGGGDNLLEEHLWAHDLPLDMGLLYGLPGLIGMTGLLAILVRSIYKWARSMRGAFEIYEMTMLSVFIAALVSCLISPPDLAFMTPLVLIGAFARERAFMEAARASARRRAIARSVMLPPVPANGAHV